MSISDELLNCTENSSFKEYDRGEKQDFRNVEFAKQVSSIEEKMTRKISHRDRQELFLWLCRVFTSKDEA